MEARLSNRKQKLQFVESFHENEVRKKMSGHEMRKNYLPVRLKCIRRHKFFQLVSIIWYLLYLIIMTEYCL